MSLTCLHLSHRNDLVIIVLCILVLLSVSCEQDPEPLTTNSVITGYVYLDDPEFESPTGFEVVASGPYGQKSASISNDQFVITGLGNGNYYLDYSRENYGSVRQYGIQLFGNDTAHAEYVQLYLKPPSSFIMPSFTNISVNAGHESDLQIHITTDYSVEYTFWDVRIFMGINSDVSYQNYEHTQAGGSNYANEIFFNPYNFPFLGGTRVYVIGYSCNQRDYGYMDTYNNRWVFSTLDENNHSNVVSFIAP